MTVNCVGCSSTGNVVVSAGEFTVSISNSDTAEAANFIDHGFVSAVVNGMTAQIVLETSALAASHKFDAKVATILLTPFAVSDMSPILTSVTWRSKADSYIDSWDRYSWPSVPSSYSREHRRIVRRQCHLWI